MKTVRLALEELFRQAVLTLEPGFSDWQRLFFQSTADEKFGDYQTNFAMAASKVFKKAPRAVAEQLVAALPGNGLIGKVEIAGPGFINVFLNDRYAADLVKSSFTEKWDFSHINTAGTVVIDYSSPNIAKPMHVGHLRTTIIGDSLKRIMRFLGYQVVADNHLGDWGTQFGKLIVGWHRWLDKESFEKDPISELERIYIILSTPAG